MPTESLVTEIFKLVQEIDKKLEEHVGVESLEMKEMIRSIKDIENKLNSIINDGFVDGDIHSHKKSHESKSWYRRLFGN